MVSTWLKPVLLALSAYLPAPVGAAGTGGFGWEMMKNTVYVRSTNQLHYALLCVCGSEKCVLTIHALVKKYIKYLYFFT